MLCVLTSLLCLAWDYEGGVCHLGSCLSFSGLFLGHRSWAQTGTHHKPSIQALPGPVIPQGTSVTIICRGPPRVARYRLGQAGSSQVWYEENPQRPWEEARFLFLSVTSSYAGSYTCQYEKKSSWSEFSDPLELVVTGVLNDKPSLSVHPHSIVPLKGNVTLLCDSWVTYDKFVLSRDVGTASIEYVKQSLGKFLFSPVSRAHAGIYHCYGSFRSSPYEWSAPSNYLELIVTGVYQRPQILLQPDAVLKYPKNKTLSCISKTWFDSFHLSKEGDAGPPQHLRSEYKAGLFQATFPLSPVTLALGGTFRCYGSLSTVSSLWSSPSDPLVLESRGPVPSHHTAENTLRLGLGGVFLSLLLGLLVEARLSRKDMQQSARRLPF
ncbi:leukocyte immunoglobulin-like receptor subfamily A member 6 [Nycticebus coucang]|uniref:leukocyte immunoglobulin-like receptor subfamily A member 6 n=1 Tax=Nycticebus coucang TaxID=9470 RepID=UPI00234C6B15|nr:leukocyte immunoglobulin-like receptor subfamily A member 6 [Nycticebus coucang]